MRLTAAKAGDDAREGLEEMELMPLGRLEHRIQPRRPHSPLRAVRPVAHLSRMISINFSVLRSFMSLSFLYPHNARNDLLRTHRTPTSIFVATTARFDTADRARAWAIVCLNRLSACYGLSPVFQYKHSGKTWGKYS